MPIRLFNTLSGRTEEFHALHPPQVRMYNCGPTVYSSPHIGNFRSFLLADFLRRVLEDQGHAVTQIMNVTDVGHMTGDDEDRGEDRMELAAKRERLDPWQVARKYEAEFRQYLQDLHCLAPHQIPRATEHIQEMGVMIADLLQKGFAYQVNGNVYFAIERFPSYGKLSKKVIDELQEGYRVEVLTEKRNPKDFALWKVDKKHLMQWDAPFPGGERGFPGWHIECSAMAIKYLGPQLDIHTGGEDNLFPHHECEIAQSEAHTGREFARYWLHVKHLLVDGQKMSKSLGNFTTVAQVLERGYTGIELRYGLMRVHYRQTLNFTFTGLDEARTAIQRVQAVRKRLARIVEQLEPEGNADLAAGCATADAEFTRAICDDLNISEALAAGFGLVSEVNRQTPTHAGAAAARAVFDRIERVLGCFGAEPVPGEPLVPAALHALLSAREAARKAKDFAAADRIRDQLAQQGWQIVDTPQGPLLRQIQPGSRG